MTTDKTPSEALAQLRHLYANLTNGGVRDTASAKRIAEGLLSPAIAALEKWGSPVVAGEVVAVVGIDAGGFHLSYGGKYIGLQSAKKTVMLLKDLPLGTQLFTTPQPTQSQAGAVPLTPEQAQDLIELESWSPDAIGLNAQLLRTIRRTEAAHGITHKEGVQHAD